MTSKMVKTRKEELTSVAEIELSGALMNWKSRSRLVSLPAARFAAMCLWTCRSVANVTRAASASRLMASLICEDDWRCSFEELERS